ncbi:citryl-CoA lyase [Candidatus Woesearchaeota archaeon CG10_big_fil_rev_8_21_14_0_10_34_8]|nr:MAG: citryl-CoA lyase [Candidatus Woesearchaeota archaeon CG10_big_fil_rev_8_21_14_0_10_34_8]
MAKWKTSIAKSDKDKTLIRGYELEQLIEKATFTQMIFLIWKGEMPTKKEEAMLNTILVASAEHGISPPSITSARNAYSGSGQFNSAVAAGVLAIGEHHGGAIESCAKLLSENKSAKEIVDNAIANKQRLPGFGHKIYTTDPRTTIIFKKAEELGFKGDFIKTVIDIEKYLEKNKGRKFCINVDGAISAVMLEMGFDYKLGMGFFLMARTAGIIGHVHEEALHEKPFRRLDNEETSYEGPKERKL